MGRKSNIDKLPDELREKLRELLNNSSVTQAEIVEVINEKAGEPVLSTSSVNRYALRMQKQIEKTKQAREVAEAYMNKMGGNTRNQLGKVVNEQIRLMSFELMTDIEELKENGETDPGLVIDLIYKVSRGLKELEQAEKLNAERESDIRKEALNEAAATAEKQLKKEGLSNDSIIRIKKEILGIS